MQSEAVKLRKLEIKEARRKELMSLLIHPVTIMVGGCAAVELLQHISLGDKPATPGYFSWGLDIGWHSAKPAVEQRLISDALGTSIELAILLWGAGKQASEIVQQIKDLAAAGTGVGTAVALLPK